MIKNLKVEFLLSTSLVIVEHLKIRASYFSQIHFSQSNKGLLQNVKEKGKNSYQSLKIGKQKKKKNAGAKRDKSNS